MNQSSFNQRNRTTIHHRVKRLSQKLDLIMAGSEEDEDPEVKMEDQRSQYPDCMKCQTCLTFKMGLSKGGRGRPVESCASKCVGRTWSYLWSTGSAVRKKREESEDKLDPTGSLAYYLYDLHQVNPMEVTLDQLSTRTI